ncbi:hypothetical protein ACFVZD_22150 [Streptomyces sp. NPDC058287]|uniref:hypothetical protein n=1 Tax=unclassified Streptomyces TaxID=2593676 RepID=UPI0036EE9B47
MDSGAGEHPLVTSNRRTRRPRRRRGTRVAAVAILTALAAGSTAFALAASMDGPDRSAATVHDAGPPPTRDDMIRQWHTLLSQHGQKPPDTESMSTAQIREGWEKALTRYAEPLDMAVSICDSSLRHQLFDPDCW